MTFAQLRALFLSAVGDNASAREECWSHLTEGYRLVTVDPGVKVPELASIDESVTIALGADYAEMTAVDFSVFAILNVFNVTSGYPLEPEPGGMEARARYLQAATGKPPSGAITHYQHDGTRLYVRNTPDVATALMVRARKQVAALSDADLNSSPLTPPNFDFAILYNAVGSYHSIHPQMSAEGLPVNEADRYFGLAKAKIGTMTDMRAVEDKVRQESTRLRGYRMGPRTRW